MKPGFTKECALCSKPWTETRNSDEHIIPEAIGGRKTVSGFICESCNNETGANWDAEISCQFKVLSNMVGVKRQKGKRPSVGIKNVDFENLLLHFDGSFSINEKPKPIESVDTKSQTGHVVFNANSYEQANVLIENLKKKYEKQGYDNVSFTTKDDERFLSEPVKINLSFGGDKAGRSLVKSTLSLAYRNGIEPEACNCAIDYLIRSGDPCFGYFYTKDLLSSRPSEIIHCVTVKGLPASGMLLGYVRIFLTNAHRSMLV